MREEPIVTSKINNNCLSPYGRVINNTTDDNKLYSLMNMKYEELLLF